MKNNNHHTVPRGYLKFFAVQRKLASKNPDRICVFTRGSICCKASTKTECANGKYYSDTLENEMARGIETEYPKALSSLIENNFDHKYFLKARGIIDEFVELQAARTPETKENTNSAVGDFRENIDKCLPPLPEHLRFGDKYADDLVSKVDIEEGLKDFMPDDLVKKMKGYCLSNMGIDVLFNPTDRPFITSDNPVVRWNSFLNERIKHNLLYKENLNMRGLLILLPVHSRYCILYYDPIIYKTRKTLRLSRSEINAINRLQYVNSDKKIFFSPEFETELFTRHLFSLSRGLQEIRRSYDKRKGEGKFCSDGVYMSSGRVEKFSSFRKIPNFLKYTDTAQKIDLSSGRNWFR